MARAASNFITVDDVNERLEKGLENIFKHERFQDLLQVMSRVNNYSLNNMILIMSQKPEATMVQGFSGWKEMGRSVAKGEKALKVLAPIIKKEHLEKIDPKTQKPQLDKNGEKILEKKDVLVGFKLANVFDVSQTQGKDIPNVREFINKELKEEKNISQLYHQLYNHLKNSLGYDVKEQPTEKGVGGYYNRSTNEIVISNSEGKNDSDKFRTLVHEYGHAKLHNENSDLKNLPREHKEAQAESIAYVVSNYYGLETDNFSVPYIANWAQDMDLAKQALGEIQETAKEIINTINELQKDRVKDFYIDNEKPYQEAASYLKNNFNIDVNKLDKNQDHMPQLEVMNKNNGIVMSAKLDFSERADKFQFKTEKNWIIPLSEISNKGDYLVLNKEKEQNNLIEVTQYKRIPDLLEVNELPNGKFAVTSIGGTDIISKGYSDKGEADKQFLKLSIAQSLHEQAFLKGHEYKEVANENLKDRVEIANLQLNFNVSKYLTYGTEQPFVTSEDNGTKIAWAIMKDKNIDSLEKLEANANTTALQKAIKDSYLVEGNERKSKSSGHELELERN